MAEILPNSPNDVASRGVTNKTLAQFKGLARQVVINVDDDFRPVIMDGKTLGGKTKVVIEKDLEEYATKTELANKADSSTLVNYATKTELGNYETIANATATYATKSELLTEGPTLQQAEIDKALTSLGVYDALEELITEKGGTVPTLLSDTNTVSTQNTGTDPWSDLN